MNGVVIHAFPEVEDAGRRLARAMGMSCRGIFVHRFPDGESLVRISAGAMARTAIVYRSLDNPDRKLVQLFLAAAALRDAGAGRVLLAVPYLAYMRQDKAFRKGEAVSQRVIGGMLAEHFDGLVTIDPHLHRTATLGEAIPGIPARAVSAAPVLAGMIARELLPDTVLLGPDAESRAWTEALAGRLGCEWLVATKRRDGDRSVSIRIPGEERLRGRPVIIVDDVLSSGETLRRCAEQAIAAGAVRVEAVVTHCLASADEIAGLVPHPLARIRATDCVAGPTNAAAIAPVLADALSGMVKEMELRAAAR